MSRVTPQILVIDHDIQIRRLLRAALESQGYRLRETTTGADGILESSRHPPEAVLLDVALPDMDGLDVLRRTREWTSIPILVISANDSESSKLTAFEAGADDYIAKPFSVPELLARLKVALRHANRTQQPDGDDTQFSTGSLHVDLGRRIVRMGEDEIRLTPIEFKVLAYMVKHAGKVLTHQQILREIWGPDRTEQSNNVRVVIYQLRHKLEADPADPEYLLTEGHVGYRLRV